MTTYRFVKLERMVMHLKRLASISDNNVLNAFIIDGPRKLLTVLCLTLKMNIKVSRIS